MRQALLDAGLEVMLDDALLLVTELVTNAVVHAGTDMELHLEVGVDRARIEVADHGAGGLSVLRGEPDAGREGGRGIFLLDALAQEWGTRHFRGGKSVWFELALNDRVLPRPVPLREQSTLGGLRPPAVSWLLGLPADLEERLTPVQLLGELLHRLCDAMDLRGGWLLAEQVSAGQTWQVLAAHDALAAAPDVEAVRRIARDARDQVLPGGEDLLVLPLRRRTGVFGALVLQGGANLDETSIALSRLVGDRMGVVLRDDRAHVAQLKDRGALALLAEASELFAGTLDVTLAVALAAQLVVPRFASWAGVFTTDERGPHLAATAHERESTGAKLQEALTASAVHDLVRRLGVELGDQPLVLTAEDLPSELAQLGEVLAVPLVARRRLLGVLLAGRTPGSGYARDDAGLLLDLARRAALAVDNARLYGERTSIAQALQASLLPPALPTIAGVDLGARYAAAGEGNEVGGDFYDVFAVDGGTWALAIGDVCGKGAEAAAITGLARNVLRLLGRDGAEPSAVLRRLNAAILDLGDRGRFCTATMATLSATPAGLDVRMSAAGHPPPVLVSEGAARFVGSAGSLLGVFDELELPDDTVHLSAGEALVFYTDGVTERRDGDRMFGDERLLEVCAAAAGATAGDLAGAVERAVRDFSRQGSRDDLAVLVVRASG